MIAVHGLHGLPGHSSPHLWLYFHHKENLPAQNFYRIPFFSVTWVLQYFCHQHSRFKHITYTVISHSLLFISNVHHGIYCGQILEAEKSRWMIWVKSSNYNDRLVSTMTISCDLVLTTDEASDYITRPWRTSSFILALILLCARTLVSPFRSSVTEWICGTAYSSMTV